MVAPGIQLSTTPVLEQYIKDGKLHIPFSFPFHKQPIKGLYQLYRSIAHLVALPLWMLRYALRGWRPRRSWTFRQTITVRRYCIDGFQFPPLTQAHSSLYSLRFVISAGNLAHIVPSGWLVGTTRTTRRFHSTVSRTIITSFSFLLLPPIWWLELSARLLTRPTSNRR